MSELENDLKVADELHENREEQKVYDMLIKYKDLQNAEVEWRLARSCRIFTKTNADEEKREKFIYEAHEHAKLALSLDDKNAACHKVLIIVYNALLTNHEVKTAGYWPQGWWGNTHI